VDRRLDVQRSSFITTQYDINAACECLQSNLALVEDGKIGRWDDRELERTG